MRSPLSFCRPAPHTVCERRGHVRSGGECGTFAEPEDLLDIERYWITKPRRWRQTAASSIRAACPLQRGSLIRGSLYHLRLSKLKLRFIQCALLSAFEQPLTAVNTFPVVRES